MINRKVSLRPVTLQDADFIFECRNDATTREASHNIEKITFSEHLLWLETGLRNPNSIMMVAEQDGELIGSVRASIVDGVYVLSWMLAPSARGRGLAKEMVAIFADRLNAPMCAEIKVENYASIRIAEAAGFKKSKEINGVLYYERGSKESGS